MKRLLIIGLIVVLGCVYSIKPAVGENGIDKTQKETIIELIRQLGNDDWQTRESAQRELIKIGEPAEFFLKKALHSQDSEIKLRARAILKRIEGLQLDEIAFELNRDDAFEIYVMDKNGKNLRKLIGNNTCKYGDPIVYSEGQFVVFASIDSKLHIIGTNGENHRVLTEFSKGDRWLSYDLSLDGNKAIVSANACNDSVANALYLVDINTGRSEKLTAGDDYHPSFSPDGDKIVFESSRDGHYQIYMMDLVNKRTKRLTNHDRTDYRPKWSPTGKQIGFVSADDYIYVMAPDGTNQKRLTKLKKREQQFVYSPDGKNIAFIAESQLYVIGYDGENLSQLTSEPINGHIIKWSLDGERIIWGAQSIIETINKDGKNRKALLDFKKPELKDTRIAELIRQLSNEKWRVRADAVEALAELGGKDVIPHIKKLLNDEDEGIRGLAAEVLCKLGAYETVPEIINLLKDKDAHLHWPVASALCKLGIKEIPQELIVLLKDENKTIRGRAVYVLGEIGLKKAVPEIMKLIKDKDSSVRGLSVKALGKLGVKEATPEIMKLLKDEDRFICISAMEALGHLGAKGAIPEIMKLLKSEDQIVRYNAVSALDQLGDKKVIPEIVKLLKDKDRGVRQVSLEALKKLTEQDFDEDYDKWLEWWKKNKDKFEDK